jgi:hypothetical protein
MILQPSEDGYQSQGGQKKQCDQAQKKQVRHILSTSSVCSGELQIPD